MLTAFTTALPSSSVLPGASTPLLVVDAHIVVLGLWLAVAVVAALVVARRQTRRLGVRPSVHAVEPGAATPSRNFSAA